MFLHDHITIGLVGDFDPSVPAHQAIPLALAQAAASLGLDLQCAWVPTEEVADAARVAAFHGLWCVPASPYRSTEGALRAIRHAREARVPFLGTCGGFQHAVIEFARNVLGMVDAQHAETAPEALCAVISPLACSLVEVTGGVRLLAGSRIAEAYGAANATETYRCCYGLNAEFRDRLLAGTLRATAEDEAGEVRAVELDEHPFFVATLFQPERAALVGQLAPLVTAFVRAAAGAAMTRTHPPTRHLAQLNIGRIKGAMDSPVMADFAANLDRINALAEASPGFVWRLQTEEGDATALRPFDDERMLVNMSVWRDVAALNRYVYTSAHVELMRRRREWFEPMREAFLVLWWVPEGHQPSVAEAIERLEHLRAHGPTPWAFNFRQAFTALDAASGAELSRPG